MIATLRPATADDLDLLVTLRLEYIRADLAPLSEADAAPIVRQLRQWIPANFGERFVAELAFVDDEPAAVAMLAVNEFPANPRFPGGRVGTVLNVWTREAHRRAGLATALMRRIIDLGGAMQLDRLDLLSSDAGLGLYEALGFVRSEGDHVPLQLSYPLATKGHADQPCHAGPRRGISA